MHSDLVSSCLVKAIIFALLLWFPPLAIASDLASQGENLCSTIEKSMNVILDFTYTRCLAAGGEPKNSLGFLLIAEKPIFSVEAAKKAWLITAVASVGRVMRENPNALGDSIWATDFNIIKESKAFIIPIAVAKELQRKVYDGEISSDQMYSRIINAGSMKKVKLPKK